MLCRVIKVIFILILLKWFFGFFSFGGAPPPEAPAGAPLLDPIGPSPGIPFNTLGISSRILTCGVMKNCMRNSRRGNNFTREIVAFQPCCAIYYFLLPDRKYENNCMCALEYIDACPDICGTSGASAAGGGGGGGEASNTSINKGL